MTRFDAAFTASYYDAYGMAEWERWDRSPRMRLQLAVYLHHLGERVKPGDRVLDAGCGSGRFTKALLDLGASVTALDISPTQLELCRTNAPGAGDYVLASITDLRDLPSEHFDVVLALGGALSYCFDAAPRALVELVRVARSRGTVGIGVMNLFGTMHEFLPGALALPVAENERVIATGDLARDANDGHECHLFRPAELRELLEGASLVDIEMSAPGWLSAVHQTPFPEQGTPEWDLLLAAELEASRESPAAGTHLIAWATKPDRAQPR